MRICSLLFSLLLSQSVFSEDKPEMTDSQGGDDYLIIPIEGDWGDRPYGPHDFCIYRGELHIKGELARAYKQTVAPEGSAENPIVISDDEQ